MTARAGRVSVAIERKELAWARARARREGTSLSTVLSAAAREAREAEERRAVQREKWQAFVAWATDGRGVSPDDLAAARRELYGE